MVGVLSADSLYKVRKGAVDIVDVPEFGFVAVDGAGDPEGPGFSAAIKALYSVSYGAHFLVKKETRQALRVMALEALWWLDGRGHEDFYAAVTSGAASMSMTDRSQWRWRAMIMQPEPIDGDVVDRAVEQARAKGVPSLDRLRYQRWEEGRCAQVLHIGPYADEGPSLVRLHEAIALAGHRARGHHHEIYLGDPRRAAPEKLRTILRQPIEPG